MQAVNLIDKEVGDEQIGGWLDTIRDVILTADDLPTAREAIFGLYPELDTAKFAKNVENYLTLSSMAGYWEAGNE
jgi:hypothetical protein